MTESPWPPPGQSPPDALQAPSNPPPSYGSSQEQPPTTETSVVARRSRRPALALIAVLGVLAAIGVGVGVGVAVSGGNGSGRSVAATSPSASSSQIAHNSTPVDLDVADTPEPPEEPEPPVPSVLALGAPLPLQSTNSTTGDVATADVRVFGIEAKATSTNPFSTPSGQYVRVDVGTTGTSTASFPYNALDFVLQDTSGQIYQPTFAAGFDPAYNSGDIAQGQSVRGNVIFDIPAGATVKQVNYQVPSGVLGSWALP